MDRVGLFSTFDEYGLYRMSVKNGYQGSFKRWKYYSGSVLIIDVVQDLCLGPTESPGQNAYSTIQITVKGDYSVQDWNWQNSRSIAQAPQHTYNIVPHSLYVTTVIPGKCIIGSGQAQWLTEGPTPAQIYALLKGSGTKQTKETLAEGGSFQSKTGMRDNLKPTPSIHPITTGSLAVSRMAPAITHQVLESIMSHVGPSTSATSGGDVMGGDVMGGRVHHKRTRE